MVLAFKECGIAAYIGLLYFLSKAFLQCISCANATFSVEFRFSLNEDNASQSDDVFKLEHSQVQLVWTFR